MKLELTRPLAFIEIQATSPSGRKGQLVKHSRIMRLAAVRVKPSGSVEAADFRCADGAHTHGQGGFVSTPFASVAGRVADYLKGCDLAGFNLRRFDLPLLAEEFSRAGQPNFPMASVRVVDVQSIFHKYERRDLAAAVKFYLDRDYQHRDASNDARMAWEIFQRQLDRYDSLPGNVSDLDLVCSHGKRLADFAGLLFWNDGDDLCWNFGKHQHQLVTDTLDYTEYFLKDSFPAQSQRIVAEHIGAEWLLRMSVIEN